jgi:uncharacterized protein YfaS (alpha-2-macroglobulin family)
MNIDRTTCVWIPDTLYWNPQLQTGEDGTAEFEIPVPDRISALRIIARAVSGAEAFGEARSRVRISP